MKKKFVTGALAIASAAVLTLSFAGCKKEENISKEDFINGIYSSYATYNDNYDKANEDPTTFGGMSIRLNGSSKSSYDGEWEYTPVGSSASATQTYTVVSNSTLSLTVDVKTINDDIHLFVNAVEKESGTTYIETADGSAGPKAEKKYVHETTTMWEFGKSGEDFFARTSLSEAVGESLTGEPSLGTPTTTKEYMTYVGEESYYNSLLSVLEDYSREYAMQPYSLFSYDPYGATITMDNMDYFKSGDTYKAVFSTIMLYNGKMKMSGTASFGPQGITYFEANTSATRPYNTMEASYNYHIDYSSNAEAVSDPFTGYTKVYSLDPYDALFRIPYAF